MPDEQLPLNGPQQGLELVSGPLEFADKFVNVARLLNVSVVKDVVAKATEVVLDPCKVVIVVLDAVLRVGEDVLAVVLGTVEETVEG